MLCKALRNFTGKVAMSKDEIKDIEDVAVVNDLVKAGYIVKVDVLDEVDLSGKPVKRENKKSKKVE